MLPVGLGPLPPPSFTFSLTDLQNPTFPGAKYWGLLVSGGLTETSTRIILPAPPTDDSDDLYLIDLSQLAVGMRIDIANDPVTGAIVTFFGIAGTELNAPVFVQDTISGGQTGQIRSWVLVTTAGAFLVPGYSVISP